MSTPLEVIQKNEEKFADKLLHPREYIRTINNDNTLALLQALHDELEGKKRKVWTEKEFQMLDMVGMQKASTDVSYNQAIQDQQDNLQALMDSIRA